MVKVHYFFDPMCGWCYGASSLIEALNNSADFELTYHPGGMMCRQAIDPSFRQHILRSDEMIAEKTGAVFGDAYKSRVVSNQELVFDSYLATRAILVAEDMGLNLFTMLKAIQASHYQDGGHIEVLDTLKELAVQYGLDESIWVKKMHQSEASVANAIFETQKLMSQSQVNCYPTLIAKVKGEWIKLPHGSYYQRPEEWKTFVNQLL